MHQKCTNCWWKRIRISLKTFSSNQQFPSVGQWYCHVFMITTLYWLEMLHMLWFDIFFVAFLPFLLLDFNIKIYMYKIMNIYSVIFYHKFISFSFDSKQVRKHHEYHNRLSNPNLKTKVITWCWKKFFKWLTLAYSKSIYWSINSLVHLLKNITAIRPEIAFRMCLPKVIQLWE